MDLTLIKDGVFVMVIGMGTVFVFLTVMILIMNLNGKVLQYVNKFFPEEVVEEKKTAKRTAKSDDEEIALAIACVCSKAGRA